MKKIILLVLLFLAFGFAFKVWAVDIKSATPSAGSDDKAANDILNRITNKVSELSENSQKSYSGKVRSLGKDTLSITTDSGEVFAETNDATNFYSFRAGVRKTIEFTNLKVKDDVTIIGTLDETTKTITARQIVDKIRRVNFFGKISDVKKDLITISLADNQTKVIDSSSALTIKKLSPTGQFVAAKSSELTIGNYLGGIGYVEDDSPNIPALKVYFFPAASPSATPKVP